MVLYRQLATAVTGYKDVEERMTHVYEQHNFASVLLLFLFFCHGGCSIFLTAGFSGLQNGISAGIAPFETVAKGNF